MYFGYWEGDLRSGVGTHVWCAPPLPDNRGDAGRLRSRPRNAANFVQSE